MGSRHFEHHSVIVFEEDLKNFIDVLRKTLSEFKALKESKQTNGKSYSVTKIRETHEQAYFPWSSEDDDKLELLFCEGKTIKELAEIFRRKEGAIISRITKLELREKYEK